jgi:hypothetical protein
MSLLRHLKNPLLGGFFMVAREAKMLLFLASVILGAAFAPRLIDSFNAQQVSHADQITWEVVEEAKGLEFKKLGDHLYSLTGSVRAGDCEKIARQFPKRFVVILESPGGNLAEGICLASHIKIREVITVVRDSPVLHPDTGEEVYTPGAVGEDKTRVSCASACGLMFLGGDERHLKGNIYFGIHGPRTPEEYLMSQGKAAIEQNALQTAGKLLLALKKLGVKGEGVRMGFIMIPGTSMYWLHPRDFKAEPNLMYLATHYQDFWGFTASDIRAGL